MRVSGYTSAGEFFEAVRDAAVELERTERQLQRLRSSEGVRAQGYEARGRSGSADASGMAATDARMDYESRMQRRIQEDRDLVTRGVRLCYGEDGRGGVAALLGSLAADSVYLRYCEALSWAQAAEAVGASAKSVQRWCEAAIDTMDAHGPQGSAAGIGMAEDRTDPKVVAPCRTVSHRVAPCAPENVL